MAYGKIDMCVHGHHVHTHHPHFMCAALTEIPNEPLMAADYLLILDLSGAFDSLTTSSLNVTSIVMISPASSPFSPYLGVAPRPQAL